MSLKFTKEMFRLDEFVLGVGGLITFEYAAEMAQNAFDKWLESQPIVVGYECKIAGWQMGDIKYNWAKGHPNEVTHQARLVNIEPIEKPKPCEHEPIHVAGSGVFRPGCFKCGKQLRATGWEEAK